MRRQELQDRGLPQSILYEYQTAPQAEPDEVVKKTERGKDGKFVGRKAGAVATTLAPKEVEGETKPHLKGSTYQLDLIDFRSLGAVAGFAMVAVDVATRKTYGAVMADKSVASIIAAFEQITGGANVSSVLAPSLIDTDQERGWTGSARGKTF